MQSWYRYAPLALLLLGIARGADAQRRVSGIVTAETSGEPIPDVNIVVQGTTIGARTGTDGRFVIAQAPAGALALIARRIGFTAKTVPVAADVSDVKIVLVQDVLRLQEQVTTGEATTVARANLAHDVAIVSAEDLTRTVAPTVENALQGKIAGAQISSNSGAPGGSLQVRLRGVASINASATPLYVIDGAVVNNVTINSGLNAITGASGGVNSSSQDVGVNRVADLNPNDIESIEVLKGPSASAIYGSEAANGVIIITTKKGQSGKTRFTLHQTLGTQRISKTLGSRHFGLDSAIAYSAAFGATPAQVTQWYNATGGYRDWENDVYGNSGLSQETALGISGGTPATAFYMSGLYHHDEGIMYSTGYDKQSIRLNVNHLEGSKLTLGLTTTFVHTLTNRGFNGNTNRANISPYIVFAATPAFYDFRPENGVYPVNPFTNSNPLQTLSLLKDPEEVMRGMIAGSANYQFLASERNNLALQLNAGFDQFTQKDNLFAPSELQFEGQDGLPGTTQDNTVEAVVGTYSATLVHRFTPKASFQATSSLGFRGEYQKQTGVNIVTQALLANQHNVDRGSTVSLFEDRNLVQNGSLYAQEELLTLNERLLLTAGVLGERSTNDGDKNKFYIYPKVSASYRLPQFWGPINEFKLRAALGETGNQPLYGMKFTPLASTVYLGSNGVQLGSTLGSNTIRPERQTEIEGGFDIDMYTGRLGLTVTGYQKRITDMILRQGLSPSTGYTTAYLNGGRMRNRGVEIGFNAVPLQLHNGLNWDTHVTFARNVGLVEALPIPGFVVSGFGYSYGQGRIEVGQSPTQIVGWAPADVGCPNFCGSLKYGDTEPDYSMGFSNHFAFGHWQLYGLLDWRRGMYNVDATHRKYDILNLAADYPANIERQHRYNDEKFGEYIEPASFAKLREITLSYSLPESMTKRVLGNSRNVRLDVSGRNLFTWTNYWGLDPEVSNFGNQNILRNQDLYPYPPSRTFAMTLALEF